MSKSDREAVARKAYELWRADVDSGRPERDERVYWFRAEQELGEPPVVRTVTVKSE